MLNQEQLIKEISNYAENISLESKKATKLFQRSLVDTITNTVTIKDNGHVFVSTGDIEAMWLRDSTFQILPYLQIAHHIEDIKQLVHGVIKQQIEYIQHDPYANAFNKKYSGAHYSDDKSNIPISDLVWERKFEIDSLCAPLFLAIQLYKETGYVDHFTDDFWKTVDLIVDTFINEQNHDQSDYYLKRYDCPPQDTLSNDGRGTPVGYTGMVWSGFRPSDDACEYGYFIPGNLFIVSVLRQLLTLIPDEKYSLLKEKSKTLIFDIKEGVNKYGIMTVGETGEKIYAYEVDGLGNQLFMDDANVPSLLSLPFLNYCDSTDHLYQTTRKYILSNYNKYYYSGKYLAGVGSPHTPPDHVWPISVAMEGLTSNDINIIEKKINTICSTDAGTFQCHEGIHVDNPNQYTREWFSWSNMTYCQLIFHYLKIIK